MQHAHHQWHYSRQGRFRLLVVWSAERAKRFTEIRTLREVGIDIVSDSPFGLAGPKNIDPGIIRSLHDAIKPALHDPQQLAALERFDMPLRYMNSQDYTQFVRRLNAEESAAVGRLALRLDCTPSQLQSALLCAKAQARQACCKPEEPNMHFRRRAYRIARQVAE